MPAPYSDDLRQKALAAIDRGERKSQVSNMFNISRNTLDLWLLRRETTGSEAASRDYQRGPAPKIADCSLAGTHDLPSAISFSHAPPSYGSC